MGQFGYVFPGQGSQFVGMGKDIYDNFSAARLVFEEASDHVRVDLKKLAFLGPESDLLKTENTQPAIFVTEAAIHSVLRDIGIIGKNPPVFTAGHSLGEYAALYASDAFSLKNAVDIVRKRGLFMQNAVPEGEGAMAAVLGFDREKLEKVIKDVTEEGNGIVAIANLNAPGQIVISGHKDAVLRASARITETGGAKVIPLKVSIPSHCSLMEGAATKLKNALDSYVSDGSINEPKIPVISNATALPYRGVDSVVSLLTDQLTKPVRWEESVSHIIKNGVTIFYEIGPGKVLQGLIKRIDRKVAVISIGDMQSLKDAEKQ